CGRGGGVSSVSARQAFFRSAIRYFGARRDAAVDVTRRGPAGQFRSRRGKRGRVGGDPSPIRMGGGNGAVRRGQACGGGEALLDRDHDREEQSFEFDNRGAVRHGETWSEGSADVAAAGAASIENHRRRGTRDWFHTRGSQAGWIFVRDSARGDAG